jgi:putative nucleotidyltransferase with HDIG domain
MEGFWKHSIGVGILSKIIANKMGIHHKLLEEYFICGIVHDIGKLVISFNFPEDYLKAVRMSVEGNFPLLKCEDEVFGTNHCKVGYELGKKWTLTDELKEIILFHHFPKEADDKYKKIVYITYVANTFCNQNDIGFAGDKKPPLIDPDVLKYLNIKEEELYENEQIIEDEINKASVFMKIK